MPRPAGITNRTASPPLPAGVTPATAPAIASCPSGNSYIELMAVVDRDEAASSPLGSWVDTSARRVGETPAALCLRTDDIEGTARRTGSQPLFMCRTRPDGVRLEWHLVGLGRGVE